MSIENILYYYLQQRSVNDTSQGMYCSNNYMYLCLYKPVCCGII